MYVMSIFILGQVLCKEKGYLVQEKKDNWLIKTVGKEGFTKDDTNINKPKGTSDQKLLEQVLKQLDKEDVILFQNLPKDKKKEVLKRLRKLMTVIDYFGQGLTFLGPLLGKETKKKKINPLFG